MASTGGTLAEPHVLAHTKQRLFPADADAGSYSVVDTQFATDEWMSGERIDPEIQEVLAPFNHVQVGGGFPDLVGVRKLESELLAVDRFGDEPPLIVVEAKGDTPHGGVDTKRGIVQAYDRLHEANAAYLAAPIDVITQTDRTLARELNVGILGVTPSGDLDVVEVPRVVGNRTTDEATAIRFQASAQGVADKSFTLNHPKNYLGYPLAHYADGSTADLLTEYNVVGATDAARQGAAFLGLITEHPNRVELTGLGAEVVRFGVRRYGSPTAALAEFDNWYQRSQRFYDMAPEWGQLARRVIYAYPATQLLVEELQQLHDDWVDEPTLPELVETLHVHHPSFTVELFIRGSQSVRSRVLNADGELQPTALTDGEIYHSPTVFQLKAMLYHAGILTERGAEPTRLDPTSDVWALRDPI